jgi:hypothetical protein
MMIRRFQSGPIAERARRSVREIVLAVALTLAAVVFVVAAIVQGSVNKTASISAPQPTEANQSN